MIDPSSLRARALRAWSAASAAARQADPAAPELVPIGLHECRHTFASPIAAGVSAKALSTAMGIRAIAQD